MSDTAAPPSPASRLAPVVVLEDAADAEAPAVLGGQR